MTPKEVCSLALLKIEGTARKIRFSSAGPVQISYIRSQMTKLCQLELRLNFFLHECAATVAGGLGQSGVRAGKKVFQIRTGAP